MRLILVLLTAVWILGSCSLREENEKLKQINEQLEADLQESKQMAETLEDIGVLLDSIDQSRNLLRLDLETGTSYQDFTTRMGEINDHVKSTQRRIEELEKSLGEAADASNVYASSVRRLKAELDQKSKQLQELQQMVNDYKAENEALLNLVDLQDAEIEDKAVELEAKREELEYLELRIEELMIQSQMTKADAYYARAQAVEEAARRTKLASKKKKETLNEALYLYRQAFDLGKTEAAPKVRELEGKL